MSAEDFSGEASGNVKARVPIFGNDQHPNELGWLVSIGYQNLSLAKPIDGQMFTDGNGTIVVDPNKAVISAKAKLNGAPAEIDVVEPFGDDKSAKEQNVELVLDDKARNALVPGLEGLISGPVRVKLNMSNKERQPIQADLTDAQLMIPWAGWTKGAGVSGEISFVMETDGDTARLSDLKLRGKSFSVDGDVTLDNGSLRSGRFSSVKLNRDDSASLTIDRSGRTMKVNIKGKSLDVRSIVNQLTTDAEGTAEAAGGGSVSVEADVASLTGFNGEQLSGVSLSYRGSGARIDSLNVTATTASGAPMKLVDRTEGDSRRMDMESTDAGAVLRFLDIYKHMEGGTMKFALAGPPNGTMRGQIDAVNFTIVDEPKLASIVSSSPSGDQRSLNEAVRRDIDTKRVKFERGYALLEKGQGSLALERGVLRGPVIGTTFQGTVYDKDGNIDMTGTFMPAYGLNRIFGELPLVGIILGNGRDRGLIGVTYRLHGKSADPNLQINPLSIIAPGIFRQIFEFR
jgi:hypothetical protein